MSVDAVEIFTEDIDSEQWQMLLRLTYAENIQRYMASRSIGTATSQLVNYTAGCVRQAHEYFLAGKSVTVNTAPLLYYYGVTNLMAAVCSLLDNQIPSIEGHGLWLDVPGRLSRIADLTFVPQWKQTGAFRIFCETLANGVSLTGGKSWTLLEIFSSVPELNSEFEHCYPDESPHIIPVETVRLEEEEELDRIHLANLDRFDDIEEALSNIENFNRAYLNPHKTKTHLVLRYKLRREEIGIYCISGQKFLPLCHTKNSEKILLPPMLYFFMGLYVLGFVSRYKPDLWTSFVREDKSGELNMVQQFIRMSARVVPNLALNALYHKTVSFVTQRQGTVDLSEKITLKIIREIVRRELQQT